MTIEPWLVSDLKLEGEEMAVLAMTMDESTKKLLPVTDTIVVQMGEKFGSVPFRPLRELLRGDTRPPSFDGEPPSRYLPLFHLIESALVDACEAAERPMTDRDIEHLFAEIRRRPDSKNAGVVASYVRAAFCVILTARPTSQAEFEAIVGRLVRSARTFSTESMSRNYLATLRSTIG